MQYSYDPATAAGQVRLLAGDAPDADAADLAGARTAWKCAFADEEIAVALSARNGAVYETASDLLLMAASNAAILSNMIRIGDYQLDNRGLAQALRTQAWAILGQAEREPAEAIADSFGNVFQTREQLIRGLLSDTPGWELP